MNRPQGGSFDEAICWLIARDCFTGFFRFASKFLLASSTNNVHTCSIIFPSSAWATLAFMISCASGSVARSRRVCCSMIAAASSPAAARRSAYSASITSPTLIVLSVACVMASCPRRSCPRTFSVAARMRCASVFASAKRRAAISAGACATASRSIRVISSSANP